MKKLIAFAALLTLPSFAEAAAYKCQLILVLEDPTKGFTHEFTVDESNNASHGGEVFTHAYEGHEFAFMANDRWLGVSWSEGGRPVAQAIFVVTGENEHRAALVNDPMNLDRQLSIDCVRQ